MTKLLKGWPSWVLLTKYQGLLAEAEKVEKLLEQVLVESELRGLAVQDATAARKELQQAVARVVLEPGKSCLPTGLFFGSTSAIASLEPVFGEPFGWRWLHPFARGGSGDPLQPTIFDAVACDAWEAFALAMERCEKALGELQGQMDDWSRRLEEMAMKAETKSRAQAAVQPTHNNGLGAPQCVVESDVS
eukprot:gnl/TRDRNA2_/TRDRNA2_87802_c0_seq1.p2 gnl/TRDRNA2_/TRDRNA2_87802_c0~~gnl/TRDRNA2_/TRDRNA2_87802_c0_seq1.p2  ORF type:complete len:190 (-),score=41.74 gnl/TRDRNA2_/TRDRNA2_87802_c0_seq1:345-914(-)